jgi:tetratricopeptide (TPR) repeat protein
LVGLAWETTKRRLQPRHETTVQEARILKAFESGRINMESYRLDSKIIEDDKEYLIQTVNDSRDGVIKTTLFMNGEALDSSVLPHAEVISDNDLLNLVKSTHVEKKSELEYLLQSFKEVISGGQPEMLYHLGTALFYKRMYSHARELFLAALKQKPDYHEASFFLSQAELAAGHIDAAIKAGLRAAELRSQFADYRNVLGEAYLAAGSCKRAAIEFEEAIKLNIYYADAYFNLALAYILNAINKEDFEMYPDLANRTLDVLKKAILINPSYKTATYDEAIAAFTAGQQKRAFALLKGVRDEKKELYRQEKASHFNRFLLYTDWISYNSIAERISRLEREIEKNPGYVDLYNELAICHLHQAKFGWKKGIDYFRKTLEINPDLAKARRSLEIAEEHFLRLSDALFDITEKCS